jgi:hypothetical protein
VHCVCNFCVVYCFECVCVILCIVLYCIVLCIVVPLPPGTYPLAVNNNNILNAVLLTALPAHVRRCQPLALQIIAFIMIIW